MPRAWYNRRCSMKILSTHKKGILVFLALNVSVFFLGATSVFGAGIDWSDATKKNVIDKIFELKTDKTTKEFLLETTLEAKFICGGVGGTNDTADSCKYLHVEPSVGTNFNVTINPAVGSPKAGETIDFFVYLVNKADKLDILEATFGFKVLADPAAETAISTTAETDNGSSFIPKKPEGYNGPLPDCAFDGSCRNVNDVLELMVNWGQRIFGLIGSFALVMFVYGGFVMILSAGNAEKVKQGRDILTAAVIGLVIAFSAYLLIDFILDALNVSNEFRGVNL